MLPLLNSTSSPCPSIPATTTPTMSQSFSADNPFKHATKHPKQNNQNQLDIKLNHKYLLSANNNNISGTCAFIGNTNFANGEWIGLIIENNTDGNTNGTINNQQYFICPNNKGLFIRKSKIIQEIPTINNENDTQSETETETENENEIETSHINSQKIAVSFFSSSHEHIESTDIKEIFSRTNQRSDEEDTPLSSSTIRDNILQDDTPDTFTKLNDYFTSTDTENNTLIPPYDDDQRRVSMMETLNGNDTLHISALLPIKKRMNIISSNEEWTPLEYEDKNSNDKSSFLEPKINVKNKENKLNPKTIIKKMGPIDIGRIEYKTPFEEIEKSPFNIETYKTWYPKRTPQGNNNRKLKDKNRNNKSPKAWIEQDDMLIKNPKYIKRIKRNNNKLKPNKKKKKKKAKSSRVEKKSKNSYRTSSGPIIRLNRTSNSSNNNNINVILEDSCTENSSIDYDNSNNVLILERSQSHSQEIELNLKNEKRKSQSAKRWQNDTQTIKIKHFFL